MLGYFENEAASNEAIMPGGIVISSFDNEYCILNFGFKFWIAEDTGKVYSGNKASTSRGEYVVLKELTDFQKNKLLHHDLDYTNKDGDIYHIRHLASNAARALGSIKSDKKSASSAENGKKGGRPRKETNV